MSSFTLQSKTWTEVNGTGRMPPPRHSHLLTFHKVSYIQHWSLIFDAHLHYSHSELFPTPVMKDALFLFGGLDELGAQSTLMYRMALPPGENYTTAKPEWFEWDSELPYNKSRTCTFFQGSLSIYQVWS